MDFDIKLDELDDLFELPVESFDGNSIPDDIAVVGLSVKAGYANDAQELWDALCRGENFVRELPLDRQSDADAFGAYLGKENIKYAQQSYLDRVDLFCPSYFHIPPKDAALLDPAQRIFLLTAWRALEDAGLSKNRLSGSDTGVFVGYSTSEHQYSTILSNSNPEFADRALSGTVNSIIASRLSYYLNLKGPAIMVDTACSSSLVAVHLACNALRSGECSMAIAGGVMYRLIPEALTNDDGPSVTSKDGQTRTFDAGSDGTNAGEGVAALILKPLSLALRDKDRIYALIKGSAVNQDGASVGITAPNATAQEDAILRAWEMSGIDPEQVSYIEAHGTATKLGDPVEISGIQGAFRKYTNKKQFCAIGSIKTNMGHLDSAAGIMGLVKCILALKHKQLPPHLNFVSPNPRIDFMDSPVYVNDSLQNWTSDSPLICGVSSFGMSGTNCHVILQEYEAITEEIYLPMVLPLSARNREELILLAERFEDIVMKDPANISNYIYTAAVSKSDESERFAVIVHSVEDLVDLKQKVKDGAVSISDKDASSSYGTSEATLPELCGAYLSGAQIQWHEIYRDAPVHVISGVEDPFKLERCWQNPTKKPTLGGSAQTEALLDVCLTASPLLHVYATIMSEETHSEVREHMIGERNVLAGTVYVEMLRCAAEKMLHTSKLQIDSLIFMTPMIFEKEQSREVQTVLYRKNDNDLDAVIQSRLIGEQDWTVHIQAKVSSFSEPKPEKVDVTALLSRMGENVMDRIGTTVDQMVTTGPRWKVQKGIWISENEAVTTAAPDAEFAQELEQYSLYPSMLDAAVNCSSVLNGDIFCLPYYYGSMRIYGSMSGPIYSHTIKNLESSSADGEIHVFDIQIFDENGDIIATVKDYAMKKTSSRQTQQFFRYQDPLLRRSLWIPETTQYRRTDIYHADQTTVLVSMVDRQPKKLYQAIKAAAKDRAYELVACDWPSRNTERKTYVFPDHPKGFVEFFEEMERRNLSRIVFFLPDYRDYPTTEDFVAEIEGLAQSFFHLVYAVASNKALGNVSIDILIPIADGTPSPVAMLIAGMGKSVLYEYSRLNLRCVLVSADTAPASVLEEMSYNHSNYTVMLRDGQRLVPQITAIQEPEEKSFRLRKNGTYLITGGTGGIGLVIADLFADIEPDINLILASRSAALPQELWQSSMDPKYKALRELAKRVRSIRCISCDVGDPKAVASLMKENMEISGIVHAAGLPGGGFVIKRKWQDLLEVLRPKVHGTYELMKYAQQRNMDFIAMFSSYSTVLPVAGQSDYIGANSFLDAYADFCADSGRVKVINWSGWRDCGMALANGVDMERSPVTFLSNEEGKAAFLQAMECSEPRVLIGRFNYKELASALQDYEKVLTFDEDTLAQIRAASSHSQSESENYTISVKGKDSPLTPTEEKVAQAWAKTLGLREVHYQDRFLEIGGDSLSATYLQKEVEKLFPGTMDITDVFVYPTIEQMSDFIDSKIVVETEELLLPETPVEQEVEPTEEEPKLSDTDQMRKLLELLASGEIDVGQAGQLL
ncbi:MAG: KR domain-containing protein [Oscillospiraceae bacterium]|nr:KR domain-containing protein [Oscillospiraceae bacterium]